MGLIRQAMQGAASSGHQLLLGQAALVVASCTAMTCFERTCSNRDAWPSVTTCMGFGACQLMSTCRVTSSLTLIDKLIHMRTLPQQNCS